MSQNQNTHTMQRSKANPFAPFALCILLLYPLCCLGSDQGPWSENFKLPGQGLWTDQNRLNVFNLSPAELEQGKLEGFYHALNYPVSVTELTIPYRAFQDFLTQEAGSQSGWRAFLRSFSRSLMKIQNAEDFRLWLGLSKASASSENWYPREIPKLAITPAQLEFGLGATLVENPSGTAYGVTFGCATCHTSELFGKTVFGLSNRFPRANVFFYHGEKLLPLLTPRLFQHVSQTTDEEREIYRRSREAIKHVGVKKPQALGLDTSLAQVALSLAKREPTAEAKKSSFYSRFPRKHPLENEVADSKPAVWWTLKYKTRWLSDGSIISGNPILTNFLWNEVGRGTDLSQLADWMEKNPLTIQHLTTAVFATTAPHYTDFFSADSLNESRAQAGEELFNQYCSRCHGQYEKGWSLPNAAQLSKVERLKNTKVWYHRQTPVVDVGTDPGRYRGMKTFAENLNLLTISRRMKTKVAPQKGYVPPPLEGIWARWPYFHNNSIPNLCALLTASAHRPRNYWSVPAQNPKTDFDQKCNGYPLTLSEEKKKPENFFDTRLKGLSNSGHDEGIFLEKGRELLSGEEKLSIIEYLKTL
jgi:mono/diheme cytochrome c family protein